MHNKKYEDDYFDDNFEVTYTEELPGISIDLEDEEYEAYEDAPYRPRRGQTDIPRPSKERSRKAPRRERESSPAPNRTQASDLASPLRAPMRAGTKLVERIVSVTLRAAPVVMCALIILLTLFVVWTEHTNYGELSSLSAENLTLILYLAVGAVLVLWELCSFFFILGGVWSKTGRGITFFLLIYACSYITSLFAGLIPEGLAVLDGIKGGLMMYGSLYPRLFTPCLLGIITCIFQKISK